MKNLLFVLFLALPFSSSAENDPKENKETAAAVEAIPATVFMGTVASMENYQPLSGCQIEVSCTESDFQKVINTDAKGKFSIDQLPEGVYNITIKRPGFETVTRTQTITEGTKLNLGFMMLQS